MIKHDVTKHPRYLEAVRVAEDRNFSPFWIRTNADVRAVVEDGCWFDAETARKMTLIIPLSFKHSEGEWAGKGFIPEFWQILDICYPIFGWRKPAAGYPEGFRRYNSGYIEVPRKNGKTQLFAAIGLICTMADVPRELGAQVYCVSEDTEQASALHGFAVGFVEQNELLDRNARCYRNTKAIEFKSIRSVMRVLSGKPKHGKGPHVVLADELHQWRDRELWAAMQTGSAHRRQPLRLSITTAGWDRESICWEEHEYARQLLDGTIDDPNYFGIIYAAEPEDDWTDEATWRKANPNYGVSVKPEFLRGECEKAKNSPAYQNTFRRLYLNQWTQQSERWIDVKHWDACKEQEKTRAEVLEMLAGRPCYGGVDLSQTDDLTATALVFPPVDADDDLWWSLVKCFLPKDDIVAKEQRDRVEYTRWAREGWLILTEGNVVDFSFVRDSILADMKLYDVLEIGVDPANATQFTVELANDYGAPVFDVRQAAMSLSPGMKRWHELVISHKWRHVGNPVESWAIGNLQVKTDSGGNVRPDKSQRRLKIDPVSAIVTAMARAIQHSTHGGSSMFANSDLVFVDI